MAQEKSQRPLLVYNTGRTVAATLAIVSARELPEPDYIIGSVGTELHAQRGVAAPDFHARFIPKWDLKIVERLIGATTPATMQADEFQNPFKSSWCWIRAQRADIELLRARLAAEGIAARVEYSCRYFLDIVPAQAGKGHALAWLCRFLRIPLERVLVAGDTGNDTSMFLLPGVRGIVVENALPELRAALLRLPVFNAGAETADGVLEGLQHFQLLASAKKRNPGC